jgi:hypothetical protein
MEGGAGRSYDIHSHTPTAMLKNFVRMIPLRLKLYSSRESLIASLISVTNYSR